MAVRRRWEGGPEAAGGRIVFAATGCGERSMKAATGIKLAFGILALYMSIPLTILAAQRMAAQAENSRAAQQKPAVAALARR
jgi:hypothetical protein